MLLIFILFRISNFQYVQAETLHPSILPDCCKIDKVKLLWDQLGAEKIFSRDYGIRCDVYNGYRFSLTNESEYASLKNVDPIVGIKWPSDYSAILDNKFSILNMFYLFKHIFKAYSINFYNLNGFDLNLMGEDLIVHKNINYYISVNEIIFFGCKMSFYDNQKKINTCEHILGSNNSQVLSIFQIDKTMVFNKKINGNDYLIIRLLNNQFISPLCPLVFNSSTIYLLQINALANTFYKRNILTFSKLNSSMYKVNSDVKELFLTNIEEIDIDSQLLNPLVFAKLAFFNVEGTIKYIEKEVFKSFENLEALSIYSNSFRKIVHNSGIKWIKSINQEIKINMTNPSEIYNERYLIKKIILDGNFFIERVNIEDVFPEEDFCVYHDFPFNQLILLIKLKDTISDSMNKKFTCTFLWIVKYYKYYHKSGFQNEIDPIKLDKDNYTRHILNVLNNANYESSLSKCFFPRLIDLCNKSNYAIKPFFDTSDYMELNEIFKIFIKILSYIISLFGMITNLLVIITILHKKNKELFKEFKQFSYLWINSIFSCLILVIEILSWMSEYFYPYEFFCPEIRKSIFVQIFKIVFKECLINSLRLMCNFTYVAFTFNRISLIDKDHGKFVKFFSTIDKKTYIGVCFLISSGFSVIKYFKYEINFDRLESNFPISKDLDLSGTFWTQESNDTFFILNLIFDFLNYVMFEILTSIIDVYMVLRLRRVLDDKFKQSESLIKEAKKLENIKKEHEGALKKANKLVILNTTISILFKMPIAFLPIINVYAEFYYKKDSNPVNHPSFDLFYSFLIDSGFYHIIIEISNFFYTFSLSILLFIYLKFDKKFHEGFKLIFFK